MNYHCFIYFVKRFFLGSYESYLFNKKKIFFSIGSRPTKRKYLKSNNDVVRNDVLQINYFEQNFSENNVLWDIGSHYGHYSIFAASVALNDNQVFSFEPDSVARTIFCHNISLNKFENKITVFSDAVSNTNGNISFVELNGNSNSYITKNYIQESSKIINSVTLDFLSEKLPIPSFIKIDTEGAEIDILLSAKKLLSNKNITFICELHPFAWDNFNVKYETLIALLEDHGREITLIDPNKNISELPFYGTIIF
jgi:FkbM family methyltransferase